MSLCTIQELIDVYPTIEVVSEAEFSRRILMKIMKKYSSSYIWVTSNPELLSASDKCKWDKYLKEYLNTGGIIEGLTELGINEGFTPLIN